MERSVSYKEIIIQLIGVLFIVLFVYSAARQLVNLEVFRDQLSQAPLLVDNASWLALVIPVVEICITLLLAFGMSRRWGLYGALGLMSLLTAYIVYAVYFAPFLPCTCISVIDGMTWNQQLWFNVGFMVLALVGILIDRRERKRNELAIQPP